MLFQIHNNSVFYIFFLTQALLVHWKLKKNNSIFGYFFGNYCTCGKSLEDERGTFLTFYCSYFPQDYKEEKMDTHPVNCRRSIIYISQVHLDIYLFFPRILTFAIFNFWEFLFYPKLGGNILICKLPGKNKTKRQMCWE